MHPQEERFEHIKDELEKAGIDFDEYRYEEGALEIFSSYSSRTDAPEIEQRTTI